MKLLATIINFLLKTYSRIPKIGELALALDLYKKSKNYETQGNFEKAQYLRKEALKRVSSKYHGPLLRAEGEDRLYRLKDYQNALVSFEEAEIAMEQSASFYGISRADSIYAGAAHAAVYIGDKAKALEYRDKFIDLSEFQN